MRTLKKTLCLVLVLAMMVGLCAMGASAATLDDYKDEDTIKHQEAVALLSALSVLQGDENGFRPGDGLTRAEGAKIIAALLNASTTGLKSSFSDMAGHWADSYVAYCEGIGIISGYGDGRFGPEDKLTYAQFAKMLLVALGYDATREELTGASWEIGVAKLVNQVGLSKGIADFAYNNPITRDDAAQMAFVTLTANMVGYNGNGIAVAGGNLATPRETLRNTTYDYDADLAHPDGNMQFIENYFPDYKLHEDTDDYGFTTHYWFKGTDRSDDNFKESKTVAKVNATRILATYTTNVALVSADTLYKDGGFEKTTKDLPIYENGKLSRNTVTPVKGNTFSFVLADYAGAAVYLVDDTGNGVADRVLVKYSLLAKVTGITKAEDSATKERQVELIVFAPDTAKTATVKAETAFETESFSKGEFVLYYPNDTVYKVDADAQDLKFATTGAIELTTVDTTIGTLGKVNLGNGAVNALTVDGVRYSVGSKNLAAMGPDSEVVATSEYGKYGLNKEITLYTSNGYVMGVNTTATPMTDYVFVISVEPGDGTTDLVTNVTTWKAAYVKQDGTIVNTTVTDSSTLNHNDLPHKWAIATPRGDLTSFTLATTQKNKAITLNPSDPSLGGITSNNKTNFIVRSGSGATTTVKAYAGISAVPLFKTSTVAYILKESSEDDAKAVAAFVDYSGKTPAATETNPLFFLTDKPDGTVQDGASTYYTFNTVDAKGNVAQVNVAKTAKLDGDDIANWNAPLTEAGLYVPETNEEGVITSLTSAKVDDGYLEGVGYSGGPISAGDGIIAGANAHSVASDVAIYRFNFLGQMKTVDDLEDLDGRTGTLAVVASKATGKVTTIFFMG